MPSYLKKVTNAKGITRYYSAFPAHFGLRRRRLSDNILLAQQECDDIVASRNSKSPVARYIQYLCSASRARAKSKGWTHDLDERTLLDLLALQEGRCALSRLRFDLRGDPNDKFLRPFAPSLDRKDCKLGYLETNVRLVCRIINFGMGPWGYEAYRTAAHAIAKMDPPAQHRPRNRVSNGRGAP